MTTKTEKKYQPPDAYVFLLAAGDIDSLSTRMRLVNVHRCGHELVRISQMNGDYEKLSANFRADMRTVVEGSSDEDAAEKLGAIGGKLLSICTLEQEERAQVRVLCSTLSRYWPMQPKVLLI